VTIHKTEETELDKIELELVEPDETSMFDSGNKLKNIIDEMKKLEGE
jgi:phenylacetate-coenzyme A ligase PaaK-like adenylate-forming protein